MNCERCQAELEDYLYGEMPAPQLVALKEHLVACADCRAAQSTLEREHEIFAQYYEQAQLEPSPEMWDAIRARISEQPIAQAQSTDWWTRVREWLTTGLLSPAMLKQGAFAAALVVLSVTATALYFTLTKENSSVQQAGTTNSPTPQATAQPEIKAPSPTPSANVPPNEVVVAQPREIKPQPTSSKKLMSVALKTERANSFESPVTSQFKEDLLIRRQVARAAREYEQAIQLLETKIARRRNALDPTLVAQYEKSLMLINRSIADSRRALRTHPTDLTAGQFLLTAYSKKVELMQEVALQ